MKMHTRTMCTHARSHVLPQTLVCPFSIEARGNQFILAKMIVNLLCNFGSRPCRSNSFFVSLLPPLASRPRCICCRAIIVPCLAAFRPLIRVLLHFSEPASTLTENHATDRRYPQTTPHTPVWSVCCYCRRTGIPVVR